MGLPTQLDPRGVLGPLTADNFTKDDLMQLASTMGQLGLKTAYRDTLFDTHRYIAGTAVTGNTIAFFAVPQGGTQTIDNSSGTSYVKTDVDTNIAVANQLTRGQVFIVQSIQVILQIPDSIDTTVTSGFPLNPTPVGTALVAPVNTLRSALNGGSIQFKLGERVYESGPLWQFPAGPYGITGFAGSGETTVTIFNAFAQNGFGRQRFCHPYHTIDAGRQFSVYLNWRQLWTPNQNFFLTVALDGIRLTSVQ